MIIVVSSVIVVMGIKSYLSYKETKAMILSDLKTESAISLSALQNNLAHFMESYAVNEYEKLITNEMEKKNFIGILVEDFNMGSLLNQPAYKTGSIKNAEWHVTSLEKEPSLTEHIFATCFYKDQAEIYSQKGVKLGLVSICSTDKFVTEELEGLVVESAWEAILVSLLMITLLLYSIRFFLLNPIFNIVTNIQNTSKDGLPINKMLAKGAIEVISLSKGINKMIDTIKKSRKELKEEKERFELAIEGSQDGLWDWHVPSGKVYHSKRFETMLEYSGHELSDTIEAWTSLLHPDDVKTAMKNVNDYFDSKGSSVYHSNFRMKTKNGGWRWISGRGKAVFDDAGHPIRFVGFNTDITNQVEHQKQLDHTAKHDVLTGLPNRFLFNEMIEKSMAYAFRNQKLLAVLFIDLDGFKEVNDLYGHDMGDCLLKEVAKIIHKTIRIEDIAARLGGDEFVLALTDLDTKEHVNVILNRLLTGLAREVICYDNNKTGLMVSASIGVSFYPQAFDIGSQALLRQADQAMYKAKSAGKNRYHIYNIAEDNALKIHLEQIGHLKKALASNEFVLHYQPKVNLRTSQVVGVEALIRWQHPTDGLVYPDSFLPSMNQETQLMLGLSHWVVEQAVAQLSKWIDDDINLVMSINISSHDLNDRSFEKFLNRVISRYPNVKPSHIELEVLESTALEDSSQARELILATQSSGMKVALDYTASITLSGLASIILAG
ncbi:diguanylate cyclase [Thiomicrorhabdus aquaedulcis]|uniref:bifunctional diguanylate cyclase/phosphodiesterase n=1 Tax=Thiomicrorhabdus aquaedulcis TaxID=2211106 RepID=UPI00156230A9|nr:diguanylate cyclase [Thiomicrorhabdus aquaedulcis]